MVATPAEMHSSVASVDLSLIREHLNDATFQKVLDCVKEKTDRNLFQCEECTEMDDGSFKMIECESCLGWFHYHCVSLRTAAKPEKWFCSNCW